MFNDPIVEEVRRIRREIEAECGNDPVRFRKYLRDLQDRYKDRLYYGKPKPAIKVAKRR